MTKQVNGAVLAFAALCHSACSMASADGTWQVSTGYCESSVPCISSDIDCNCDANLVGPAGVCTLSFSNPAQLPGPSPVVVSSMGVTCPNCDGCPDNPPPERDCGFNDSVVFTSTLGVTVSESVSVGVGEPGVASVEGAFESAVGLQIGVAFQFTANCPVIAPQCSVAESNGPFVSVAFGQRWEIVHSWSVSSTWAYEFCLFSDFSCPISGQPWNAQCTTTSSIGIVDIPVTSVNCGDVTRSDCPCPP